MIDSNLSKKIETNQDLKDRILVEDVKEFIKKIKDRLDKTSLNSAEWWELMEDIDKLAGEELASHKEGGENE